MRLSVRSGLAALGLALAALALPPAAAGSVLEGAGGGFEDCGTIADRIEQAEAIPPGLLQALALAESGRSHPVEGGHRAWPWAVRAGDDGYYLPSKAAALAKVRALRAAGRSSIDVGCMQINLRYHGSAFGSLEDAFDPQHNVSYGARFLKQLLRETGSWAGATGRYHSADPDLGRAYRARVYRIWQKLRRQAGAAPILGEAAFVGGGLARLAGNATATAPGGQPSHLVSPAAAGRARAGPMVLRGR